MPAASTASQHFRFTFTVPTTHLEACKTAIFEAGGGTIPGSNYKEVCFETLGTGQFRPGAGANPTIGQLGKLEKVPEARVELLVVGEQTIRKVVNALKDAHPYEECVYDVIKLENF